MPILISRPRGISKATPIIVVFTLLGLLTLWILSYSSEFERAAEEAKKKGTPVPSLVPGSQPIIAGVAQISPSGIPLKAEAPRAPQNYTCRWAQAPITITGLGSDPVWQSAPVIDSFYISGSSGNRAAQSHTRARLLWDENYLYYLSEMDDADLFADIKDHNGMCWFNDVFELFFKPSAGHLGYYEFEITPKNTSLELYFPSRGSGGYGRWKGKFPFNMESKVSLRGTLNDQTDRDIGWTVEGRIPWKDFTPTGGKPVYGAEWKMALCRFDYSAFYDHPEESSTAPLTEKEFHRYEDYGTLKFVGPLK